MTTGRLKDLNQSQTLLLMMETTTGRLNSHKKKSQKDARQVAGTINQADIGQAEAHSAEAEVTAGTVQHQATLAAKPIAMKTSAHAQMSRQAAAMEAKRVLPNCLKMKAQLKTNAIRSKLVNSRQSKI